MKFEELNSEIEKLDHSGFIEKLNYHGVNLWPLFRYHLLLKFKDGDNYMSSVSGSFQPVSFFSKFLLSRKAKLERKKIESFHNQIIFKDDFRYNTDIINDQYYNRHIQPYSELVKDFSENKIFTTDEELKNKLGVNYLNPWFFLLKENPPELFGIEKLKSEIPLINFASFDNHAKWIILWKKYFLHLFSTSKPRIILFPCFYDPANFGLIAACKEVGIITVDIQHGKQGRFHPIYYGWKFFPEKGYSILPDQFWTWGDYFKQGILQGTKNPKFPKIITGGNAWTMKEKEVLKNFQFNKDKQFSKYVLVALQPIETDYTIDYLRKAANLDNSVKWIIRFHPVMQKDREKFINELGEFSGMDFETGNEFRLTELFAFCDAVVTLWSTVVLEGLDYGMIPFIIHPNGKEIFEEEIHSRLLNYCSTPDELLKVLKSENKNHQGVINSDRNEIIIKLKEICL